MGIFDEYVIGRNAVIVSELFAVMFEASGECRTNLLDLLDREQSAGEYKAIVSKSGFTIVRADVWRAVGLYATHVVL